MAKILVFNNDTNRMETYFRGENDRMPYNSNGTLRVREFRGRSTSPTLWTEKRAMQAWNSFRSLLGRPIDVGAGFRRPWEGRHAAQSQHYAGVAFDAGQRMTAAARNQMRNLAISSRIWRSCRSGSSYSYLGTYG